MILALHNSLLIINLAANLQSITLSPRWSGVPNLRRECLGEPSRSNAYLNGSPLARSWNIFYLNPLPWEFGEGTKTSNGIPELMFLTNALASAKINPSRLTIGAGPATGIAPTVFDYQIRGLEISTVFANTYYALTRLDLHLAKDILNQGSHEAHDVIASLGSVISSLSRLEYLRLNLPYNSVEYCGRYTYRQIFERDAGKWPRLHTFIIDNLVIGTRDLTSLLTTSMPALKTFQIFTTIKLLDGQWNWVIAFLRQLSLTELVIWSESAFINPDGHNYLERRRDEDNWERTHCLYSDVIPRYVLGGRRHPGLLPQQKDDESNRYLEELQEFLQTESQDLLASHVLR